MMTMQRPRGWDDVWIYSTAWARELTTPEGAPVAMVARYTPGLEAALVAPGSVARAVRTLRRHNVGDDSPITALQRTQRLLARVGPHGLAVLASAGDRAIVAAFEGLSR